MIVYLDSSALIKRVLVEPCADELIERIDELENGPHELMTSTLGWVEVTRALKAWSERNNAAVEDLDARALAGVGAIPISYEVVSLARKIGPQTLRSLDAIHCAAATMLEASRVISYDTRLLAAANMIGFATESPGVKL